MKTARDAEDAEAEAVFDCASKMLKSLLLPSTISDEK
jgi:hypothetical protein